MCCAGRRSTSCRGGAISWGSIGGPELDDLAQQAADDALMNILARLDDFRGLSRFTTWAYKFVVFEVSGKVARHAWRRQAPGREEPAFEQLPDSVEPSLASGSSGASSSTRCRRRSAS